MIQPLQVTAVPAFADNYLWLIHDHQHAAVVDPGDAAPIEAALAAMHLKLAVIANVSSPKATFLATSRCGKSA